MPKRRDEGDDKKRIIELKIDYQQFHTKLFQMLLAYIYHHD